MIFIHGLWPYNKIGDKFIPLRNCEQVTVDARLSNFFVEDGIYKLPQLTIKFKEVLAESIKRGHARNRDAIKLLRNMARGTYGVDVQVKNLKSPDYHIRTFLLDHEDQLIDNKKSYFSNINVKLQRR